MLLSQSLQARYFSIKNDSQFVDEINRYEFVIACFVRTPYPGKDFDRQLKKDIHLLQETVKATGETEPYKKLLKQEVGFLVVDVSKDAMRPLISKYKIQSDEMPQFLLFKNGKALTTMSGQLAKLVGFISKSDLLDFINDYFGKDFDTILAKKADEREKQQELQLARYQAYAAYRYPYGGYAPFNAWGPYTYSGYAQFYPYGYGYNGYAFFIP
jgi:hypothetical protein